MEAMGECFDLTSKRYQVRVLLQGFSFSLPAGTTSLDLSSSALGNISATAVAKLLRSNSTLTTLDLSFNSIGDEGAAALAEALKSNSTLTTLDLRSNSIGDEGAARLRSVWASRGTLEL